MALVECCLSNVSSDARITLNESTHDVRETFCLDRCGVCYDRPFLIVDGEFHDGGEYHDFLCDLDVEDGGHEK